MQTPHLPGLLSSVSRMMVAHHWIRPTGSIRLRPPTWTGMTLHPHGRKTQSGHLCFQFRGCHAWTLSQSRSLPSPSLRHLFNPLWVAGREHVLAFGRSITNPNNYTKDALVAGALGSVQVASAVFLGLLLNLLDALSYGYILVSTRSAYLQSHRPRRNFYLFRELHCLATVLFTRALRIQGRCRV